MAAARRPDRDPRRPVYVISVAAELVSVHPRTLRIYEGEGLVRPARTPTNIRLYSENDLRRILWIRHLTRDRGVNLAGVRTLFELEERLGKRILEALYDEWIDSYDMSDVLVLETDKLDYIHDLVHQLDVMERIEAVLPPEMGKPAC